MIMSVDIDRQRSGWRNYGGYKVGDYRIHVYTEVYDEERERIVVELTAVEPQKHRQRGGRLVMKQDEAAQLATAILTVAVRGRKRELVRVKNGS